MPVFIVETEENRAVVFNNTIIHSSILSFEENETKEMQYSIAQNLASSSNTEVHVITYSTPSGQGFSWDSVIENLPSLSLNEQQQKQILKTSKIKAVKHVLGETNPLNIENPPITEEDYDKIYDAVIETNCLTVTLNGVDYFLECYYRELSDHDVVIEMLHDTQQEYYYTTQDAMVGTLLPSVDAPSPLGEDSEYYQWLRRPREVLFDGEKESRLRSLAIEGDDEISLSELMFVSEQQAIDAINDEILDYTPEEAEDFVLVKVKKELVGAPFAKPEVKPASTNTPMP